MQAQISKSLRNFAKYVFIITKVYGETQKAREDVYFHLQKMRKSIIKMSLTYTDIDRLKQKIDNLVNCERKYSKFFRPQDTEVQELKKQIAALEAELSQEREEKFRIKNEQEERIMELSDSLENIKHKMRHLLIDKAKRQHRLRALEQKISRDVDARGYYSS